MSKERHEYWDHSVEPDEHVFGSDELRKRFYIIGGLSIASFIALAVGVAVLGLRGFAPPVFVGHSHGLFFVGDNNPVTSIDWDTDMERQFVDTVEVLFRRTEKGALPDLKSFVEESVLAQIESGYEGQAERLKPGYAQTLTVLEARLAPSPGAPVRRWHMMGILSSRGLQGNQTSTLYFQCDFAPRGFNPDNAVGWKLVAITRLREDEFFSEEHERERIRRLGLENGAVEKPTPPISSK